MLTKRPGYLYILYHPTYEQYGTDVYKLGWTKDVDQRIRSYRTGYLQEPEYKYVSQQLHDGLAGERVLFYILRNERCNKRREFFQASFDHIKRLIQIIESLSPTELQCMYQQVCMNLVLSSTRKKFQTPEEAQAEVDSWSEIEYTNHLPIDQFLQQFRYRPTNKSNASTDLHELNSLLVLSKQQLQNKKNECASIECDTNEGDEGNESNYVDNLILNNKFIDTTLIQHFELNRCSLNHTLFTKCLQELHIN